MENKISNPIKALLFDLGGVVIDIDFNKVFTRWAEYSNRSLKEIRSKFSFDCFYKAHERGEIDSSEYFNSLRKTLDIDISDLQFEEGWNSIYNGEIPGAAGLLEYAKEKIPIYGFTNSNHLHKKVWSRKYSKILSLFREVFVSSDIGKRKPEPDAFQMVARAMGVDLTRIVFFDDSIENIAGAQKIGMKTVHVKSVSDIETGLKMYLDK